jgi:hypothetical protein
MLLGALIFENHWVAWSTNQKHQWECVMPLNNMLWQSNKKGQCNDNFKVKIRDM